MKKIRKKKTKKHQEQDWPAVVYFWVIGLFILAFTISRLVLDAYPHQYHWLASPIGLVCALIGVPLGWLWYRWREGII